MERPTFIDLRAKSSDTVPTLNSQLSPRPYPSPKMQHFAGDVPPAMSPLDMFAMHSRMLAKQLDESRHDGRRVSRLPPLTTTDPISRQRAIYQSRSAGQSPPDTASLPPQKEEEQSGNLAGLEEPAFRPKSFYPRLSHIPPSAIEDEPSLPVASAPAGQKSFLLSPRASEASPQDYFAVPRSMSPDPTVSGSAHEHVRPSPRFGPSERQQEARQPYNNQAPHRGMSIESKSSKASSSSLHPPMSPQMKQPSIRSIPMDSSDDENSASTTGSGFSRNRKLSSSSNVSTPYSPNAPFAQATHGRSPSLNSEYSIGGTQLQRPAFNFSRPLSRGSRPSMDMPRQPSFDSRTSYDQPRPPFSATHRSESADSNGFLLVDEPQSLHADSEAQDSDGPAPSYIYNKFALPRGRMMQKNAKVAKTSDLPQLEWGRPSDVRPSTPLANKPISPGFVRHSPQSSRELRRASPRSSLEQPRPSYDPSARASPRPSMEQRVRSPLHPPEQPKISFSNAPRFEAPPTPVANDDASEYTTSTRSDATIKPTPRQIKAMSNELTAEDHLAKGIALHEKGENRESTYHLRIAAKANLPTGMLLYALACRHGWGMRPNPQEAVQWLRKAADCASVELAGDEGSNTGNFEERKTRRAQFALSIYELGQSHYNGWGIEQDRVLALKCYQIAADWGDADAMAEVGFCYAKGEGCKKDLKKAAKYYRMAEAKGMSMVGNSWIYKPKYADDSADKGSGSNDRRGRDKGKEGTPEKKARDKSRTRTIFGRKKSISKH